MGLDTYIIEKQMDIDIRRANATFDIALGISALDQYTTEGAKDALENIKNGIKEFIEKLVKTIKDFVDGIKETIAQKFRDAKFAQAIKNLPSPAEIARAAKEKGKKIIDPGKVCKNLKAAMSSVSDDIKAFMKKKPSKHQQVMDAIAAINDKIDQLPTNEQIKQMLDGAVVKVDEGQIVAMQNELASMASAMTTYLDDSMCNLADEVYALDNKISKMREEMKDVKDVNITLVQKKEEEIKEVEEEKEAKQSMISQMRSIGSKCVQKFLHIVGAFVKGCIAVCTVLAAIGVGYKIGSDVAPL